MLMWSNCEFVLKSAFMFMKPSSKLVLLFGLAGGLATGLAPAAENTVNVAPPAAAKPSVKVTDLFEDKVLAKGKGFEVKRSQLDEAMASIKAGAESQGRPIPPDHLTLIEQQVLDRLVNIQVLVSRATDADRKVGKEVAAQRLEAIRTSNGGAEDLARKLKSLGTTLEDVQAKMTEEATAQTVLERELKVVVTDDDIKKFYDDNPSKFEQPEMVRVSHILLSTKDPSDTNPNPTMRKDISDEQKAAKRKKAEDLIKQARAGADFTKLAIENSEDPGVKQNSGEYTFGRGQMVPEFEAAAFTLKSNEVSEVVTTAFGYHVIKLSERMSAKKVEMAKVSAEVKEYLKRQQLEKRQQELQDLVDKGRKEANVEILDPALKAKPPEEAAPAPALTPAKPAESSKK
jgi:peptidyl-prolyl cis-trans isomerase C